MKKVDHKRALFVAAIRTTAKSHDQRLGTQSSTDPPRELFNCFMLPMFITSLHNRSNNSKNKDIQCLLITKKSETNGYKFKGMLK